jgi:serine/threonine protein kinase
MLDHKNIIKCFESVDYCKSFLTDINLPEISYLSLEFAKYGDFFDLISQAGGLPERLVRPLFLQVLDGVEYLHKMNIAHMDLKIENILLDENF